MRYLWFTVTALVLVTSAKAQYFSGRNSAMGGTGVASSHYTAAGLANPALLTRYGENDSFGLILPTVGVLAVDEDELVDALDQFQADFNTLRANVVSMTATPAELTDLSNQLLAMDGKTAQLQIGGAFSFAVPSLNLAIVANSYVDGSIFPLIDPNDIAQITGATMASDLDTLQSEMVGLGVAITEIGVAYAMELPLPGMDLSVGVTPKMQRVDTFNYSLSVQSFDSADIDDPQFRNSQTTFNIDFGAALDPLPGLTVGLMARNLVPNDTTTVVTGGRSFAYNIDPTLTVGAAWDSDWFTIAADVDVTEYERFKRGDGTQMLRAGAELNLFDWVQLRGGYQQDLQSTIEDVYTAGFGLSPFDVLHIDIAGMTDGDNAYGAVVQLAFTF